MNMRLRYFVVKREPTTYCGLNLVDTPDVDIFAPPVPPAPTGFFARLAKIARKSAWLLEVLVCCGQLPTQTLIFVILALSGMKIPTGDQITLRFFAALTLLDTALVTLMMFTFLHNSKESWRAVFFGDRDLKKEIAIGLALIPLLLIGVAAIVGGLRAAFPSLHDVKISPYDAFTSSPLKTIVFLTCGILAGGFREELQRGFLLHRFNQHLGGMWIGLTVYTVVFGLGHITQGKDVAVAVGALGFFWGWLYIRRRSVAAAMVSHAGFDALQVLGQMLIKTLGLPVK
jgi:membrane protease YdiL (CAAX protease family)